MSREIITTDQAPQAIGTYSQPMKGGRTIYLPVPTALAPPSMKLVYGEPRG